MSAGPPHAVKGESRFEEPTRTERTLARRVAESRATVPDLELRTEVDMTSCLALRRDADERVSITAMLVKACALSLRDVPRANAAYRDGRFELYSRVNVGVAVNTEGSYAIATLLDADDKSLPVITDELAAIQERAGTGDLTPPELSGATFTLANVGAQGVESSTIVVSPPNAAALAAGAIRAAPVVRDGGIVPAHVMTLTLASDHRILYGASAAAFLMRIKTLLEQAAAL